MNRITVLCLSLAVGSASAAVQLNSPHGPGGQVKTGFRVTPDGARVVYLSAANTNNITELFTVSSEGGPPQKLNGTLVAGGRVLSFALAPDGGRVVYLADELADETNELFSVSSAGGARIKLNSSLPGGGDVAEFVIAPDSSQVVYRADQVADGRFEVFRVPISGGTPTSVNPALPSGRRVLSFRLSPDASRVVYIADRVSSGVDEIFSVPFSGGSAVKINETPAPSGDVTDFIVSPDSARVVFRGDLRVNNTNELFSAPIALSNLSFQVSQPLVLEGDVELGYLVSPDSSRVLFRADNAIDNQVQLFSASLGSTGTPLRLNLVMTNVSMDVFSDVVISPDSSRAIFRADNRVDNVDDIYSAPLNGSTPAIRINSLNFPTSRDVRDFVIAPGKSNVFFRADQEIDDVFELFSAPIDRTNATEKVSGPIVGSGDITNNFRLNPAGDLVLYTADNLVDEKFQLLAVATDQPGFAVQINDALPTNASAIEPDFQFAGPRAIYRGTILRTNAIDLFSAPLRIPGSAFDSVPLPGSTLQFGTIPAGGSASNSIQILEVGTRALTVFADEAGILSGPNAASFQVFNGPTFTLADGGPARTMTLVCSPLFSGALAATLTLDSTDPFNPTVQYSLVATGSTGSGSGPGSGTTTGGSTGTGTTSAGSSAGSSAGGTGGATTAGSGGGTNATLRVLPWTVEFKRPKAGRTLKFRAGKSGLGLVRGIVSNTGLPKKTANVLVQLALASTPTNSSTNSITNAAPSFSTIAKVGRVNSKQTANFVAKKFGASATLAPGAQIRIFARASTNFALATSPTTALSVSVR